ncbi:aminopeptidase P2 [Quercus suber]|uniref:aminopeptidase P2 n=1 Tax=Quercus suber TaxID=58331 RepID=UPI0032DF1CB0
MVTMSSLPSPLTYSHSHARCLRFLSSVSLSLPIFHKFKTSPKLFTKSPNPPILTVRNCGSITAKPSSDIRRKNRAGSEPDEKLRRLRELFVKPGIDIDAYIVPSQDAHQSEFIAECYMRRTYISGFTGSAGTAVITKDEAALWTDGRYFLQAEKQLNSCWILMRAGNPGVPTTSEWLNDVLAPGGRVGIDPFLFSSDAAEELKQAIATRNHELVYLHDLNLVDEVWGESRPKPPKKPIRIHDLKYAGLDVASKLSSLRSELVDAGSSAIVISVLDEVAWLLNLRGSDVPHSPVMYAYLIVELDGAKLFMDNSKVTPEVMDHLKKAGIELRPYDCILSEIESLAAQGTHLWLDTSSVNAAIANAYKSACDKYMGSLGNKTKGQSKIYDSSNGQSGGPTGVYGLSPISLAKAVKNHAELEGMRNSHLRDAAALAQFWVWVEDEIHKDVKLTEVEVADKLLDFRSKQAGFIDTSFDTISASGANGAIIHYKPETESCAVVDAKKLFLLDSGAQYVDGTTDITRTVHFGEPTARQKECFTRVLQVNDFLFLPFLGTGHGVGAALNVHEGPQSISFRYGNMTPLLRGMIVSNEPGYYEDHAFGIRIENLLYVKDVDTPNRFGGVGYLGFEKLTFVPIQSKLIDLSLLSAVEVDWLNDYHSQVWEKVSPLLDGSACQWLWNNTRPLVKQ